MISSALVERVDRRMPVRGLDGARSALGPMGLWGPEILETTCEHREERLSVRDELGKEAGFEGIVGSSAALREVLALVAKVAPIDATVLITGETGTGKELIARAIHRRSRRSSGTLVSVNCAATPATLIATELFGHEKGAFTGAVQRRPGRFEVAAGGTIFLDEVGELPMEAQIALLRVLQEREFERVGGTKTIRANVRVVAATNRDLEGAVAAGTFREDLYYRLNVFPIEIPPLRERRDDIRALTKVFVDRYAQRAKKTIRRISEKTLEMLEAYPWPGNIRELENVIERSMIMCDSDVFSIDDGSLCREATSAESARQPLRLVQSTAPAIRPRESRPSNATLADVQREAILRALRSTNGMIGGTNGAAAMLGVKRTTLQGRMRKLGMAI